MQRTVSDLQDRLNTDVASDDRACQYRINVAWRRPACHDHVNDSAPGDVFRGIRRIDAHDAFLVSS
jgi:hypothetical protein